MAIQRWYNRRTQADIARFKAALPQALIIAARPGLGGATLARELATAEPSEVIELRPDDKKTVIAPTQIRQLNERLRAVGSKHVVVLVRAELLGEAAQNALLKLVEEPSEKRQFIITTPELSHVLPTIRSRAQLLRLLPLTERDSRQLLDNYPKLDQATKDQVYFLAAGLPVRMRQLAEQPETLSQASQLVKDAKALLFTRDKYEKMQLLQPYTRADRSDVLEFFGVLMTMSQFLAKRSEDPARELRQAERYSTLYQYVERYGNLRLAILSLVV